MLNLIEDHGKVAVIDIGSNSLRFVIFDRYGRYPYPLFNERITCRLGDGVQKTKKLKKHEQNEKTIFLGSWGPSGPARPPLTSIRVVVVVVVAANS